MELYRARDAAFRALDAGPWEHVVYRYDAPEVERRFVAVERDVLERLLDATKPRPASVAPARSTDPDTSKEAAKLMQLVAGSARATLLLRFAQVNRSMTADTAIATAQLGNQRSPWKRVSELKAAGWIAPTGATLVGPAGRRAELLQITDAGRTAIKEYLLGEEMS